MPSTVHTPPGPPQQEKKSRIEFIDLAKGFCILLVVFHHLQYTTKTHFLIDQYTMACRMPLYFFLSGLFFKPYENFLGFLIRKTNKLLIPFLFFYITVSLAIPALLYYYTDIGERYAGLMRGWDGVWGVWTYKHIENGPVWFLWCLFIMNLYFYGIYYVSQKLPRGRILFIVTVCLALGIWGYYMGLPRTRHVYAYLDTALTALPFFCMGFLMRKYTNLLLPNRFDKYLWIVIVLLAAYTIYFTHGRVRYIDNKYPFNPFFLYTCGAAGLMAIILLAKKIKSMPIVPYWGHYSIIILLTHHPIQIELVGIVKRLGLSPEWTAILSLAILMAAYLLIIPIVLKFFPYVTAQKDAIKLPKRLKNASSQTDSGSRQAQP